MSLMRNDVLAHYDGGAQQQRRQRGFVTVSEPALGFFIAGSSIDEMNGIYVCVRNETLAQRTPQHQVLLAYRNDVKPNWIMALVQPHNVGQQSSSHSEDSDDEDDGLIYFNCLCCDFLFWETETYPMH